jgi:hypothetical protein
MSTFAWLDYSERQRRRMLEVVEMFREEGTVDELGIGAVRDALSDTLFPGSSTLHTRVRYLLFIPWIYLGLEHARVESKHVDAALKRREVRLIESLEAGGEYEGVIGIDARAKLKRFPSILYWNALEVFGLRTFRGSQMQYHRSLDGISHQRATAPTSEGDEPGAGLAVQTWHPRIPGPPEGFLETTDFALTYAEAEYLQQRILEKLGGSYLAYLVTCEGEEVDGDRPWESSLVASAPPLIRTHLAHARNFSELIHGAALLYNLILAEKINEARRAGAELEVDSDRSDEYRARLDEWAALIRDRELAYEEWNRPAFWQLIRERNPRVSQRTIWFVDQWMDLAAKRGGEVANDTDARTLVSEREIAVKKGLARVSNLRALERWSGASGTQQLAFRWRQGWQYAQDVLDGLQEG